MVYISLCRILYFFSCHAPQHRNPDSVNTTGNKAYSGVTQDQKEEGGGGNEEEADDEYVVPQNPMVSSQAGTAATTISTATEEPLYEQL